MNPTIDIFSAAGRLRATVHIGKGSSREYMLMEKDMVNLKFTIAKAITFDIGDYIMLPRQERYELMKPQKGSRSKQGYAYELKFEALYRKFANKLMKFLPRYGAAEVTWVYTDKFEAHIAQILENMNALGYLCDGRQWTWGIQGEIENKYTTMSYNSTNILDAISQLAEAYEVEWWVERNAILFGKCQELLAPGVEPVGMWEGDREGVKGNLTKINGSDSRESAATRLYVYGSDRNLSSTYRKSLIFTITDTDGGFCDNGKPINGIYFPLNLRTEGFEGEELNFYAAKNITITDFYTEQNVVVFTKALTLEEQRIGTYIVALSTFKPKLKIRAVEGKRLFVPVAASVIVRMSATLDNGKTLTDRWESSFILVPDEYKNAEFTDKEVEFRSTATTVTFSVECSFSIIRQQSVMLEVMNYSDPSFRFLYKAPAYGATPITVNFIDRRDGSVLKSVSGCSIQAKLLTQNPRITSPSVITIPDIDNPGRERAIRPGDIYMLPDINEAVVPAEFFSNKYTVLENFEGMVTNGIVNKYLMLPEDRYPQGYIDTREFDASDQIIEDVVRFEDVYPKREFYVTDVTFVEKDDKEKEQDGSVTKKSWPSFTISNNVFNEDNPFNKEYLIAGKDLEITFQGVLRYKEGDTIPEGKAVGDPVYEDGGKLTGLTFGVHVMDNSTFEIQRDGNILVPNEILKPSVGDTFILSGFNVAMLSDKGAGYITEAENELEQKALKYIEKLNTDATNYECSVHVDWAKEHADESGLCFFVGQAVNLYSPLLVGGMRSSRIIGYSIPLDKPYNNPSYYVGEKAKYSRLGEIQDSIDGLKVTAGALGKEIAGTGGVDVIGLYDRKDALDTNVYSALRANKEIETRALQKNKDDRTTGSIQSDKGFLTGNFKSGTSGGAFIQSAEGDTYIETDRLYVRKKATFETLEIVNVQSIGGKQVITPGGGLELADVKEIIDKGNVVAYKCFVRTDDGEKATDIRMIVDDLVMCKTFNISSGVYEGVYNRYYWRRCIEVGDDYIVLSNTDYDKVAVNDAPKAEDVVVQLGHKGYDRIRTNAIILSSVEGGSPNITLYTGIDNYYLEGRETIDMGVNPISGIPYHHVFGDAYVGPKDVSTYIKYDSANKLLEIKAKISAESTLGDTNIYQFINNVLGNDGVLNPLEKRQLLLRLLEIKQEYEDLYGKAGESGIDAEDYDAAYWELIFFLTGETKENVCLLLEDSAKMLLENGSNILLTFKGVLSNMDETTKINRETFLELLRVYYEERDKLNINKLYGDYTKTVIDGGLITTGTIQLKGGDGLTKAGITGHQTPNEDGTLLEDDGNDIRIWAGADYESRDNAPFRVNQAGEMWATNAHISGGFYGFSRRLPCVITQDNVDDYADTYTSHNGTYYIIDFEKTGRYVIFVDIPNLLITLPSFPYMLGLPSVGSFIEARGYIGESITIEARGTSTISLDGVITNDISSMTTLIPIEMGINQFAELKCEHGVWRNDENIEVESVYWTYLISDIIENDISSL